MRWLEKLLNVRESERALLRYNVVLFVLLGLGLALGRGSMTALFLKRYGIEYLPVMFAVLSVSMAASSLTYAAYVDRTPSERLLVRMLAVLGVALVAIWGGMTFTAAEWVYPAYFLVFELANELFVVHYKLYSEQNFDGLQLQRLAAPLLACTSIGMVIGGLLLGVLVAVMNVAHVLLVWAVLAALPVLLILRHHRQAGISPYFRPGRKGRDGLKHAIEQVEQGLRFFQKTELLRNASFALFFMVVSTFILNYAVDRVLTETFPEEVRLASFVGWISAVTAALALLLQLFVAGRLLRRVGVTPVGLVLPVSMLASFLALLASFTLPAALVGIFTREVVNKGIRRPARMAFLRALPDYMLGRVNALSVGLVLPLALLVASGLLLLTQHLPVPSYFIVGGVLASLGYLYFRARANRAYAPALLATLSHRLFLPHRHAEDEVNGRNEDLVRELVRGVSSADENMACAYARLLVAMRPVEAAQVITQRLPSASHRTRDRLLRLLAAEKLVEPDLLFASLDDADPPLRAMILQELFALQDPRAKPFVEPLLASDNPRFVATGVFGVHCFAQHDLDAAARQAWERLLSSEQENENIAGLELFARRPETRHLALLGALLTHRSVRVQRAALAALACFPPGTHGEFREPLEALFRAGDPEIRLACVAAFRVLDPDARRVLCMLAIEDEHQAVREAALALLEECDGRERLVENLLQWVEDNRGSPRSQLTVLNVLAAYRLPAAVYERIAQKKVREASTLFQGVEILRLNSQAHDPRQATELLQVVMQERTLQTLDLALMAMENFEDRTALAAIRAGLASGDRRYVAQACEALHNLKHRELCAPLIAILDPAGRDQTSRRKAQHAPQQTAADVVAWCASHPDHWLRECAARVPTAAGA